MSTEKVKNKRITLKDYVTGYPKEEDLLLGSSDLELKVPAGSNAVLLKNLYLSCDPYMRGRMSKPLVKSYTDAFTPGSVITGYGVGKVVDSGHPNFQAGDLVWGITGWEEYTLIQAPEILVKIKHTDVPLSYYTGILASIVLIGYSFLVACGKFYDGKQLFVTRSTKELSKKKKKISRNSSTTTLATTIPIDSK
ncbi:hypothetical protein IEQ34_010841 [Dendrobium chrysotoxum]|uniref:Oxidoreductase N-terminal domain-containing protein n=1 Tax=Dendrobium chrysotoxum TaxID=161865 RepID=A0AAV7GWS7_DENCH|nr:hypothetical protein IEQ34_010841 [Dendrobium chrysotoxum]